ncbi:unnamed protein product, partial [Scytosiphon promiscuus]
MFLETIEVLALTGEGSGGIQHWSRNTERPRYSLTSDEAKQASFTHSFTCFDVAERVEVDHDIVFTGRSNGSVVLWRMVARNLFGGANKNDRVEETLPTLSPHRGAVTCLTHTRPGTYSSLAGPLVFSGSTDHTIKVWNAWAGPPLKETCLQTMAEHRGGVTALAFAGDTTLISTSRDGSVRLWRPQRGRKLLRFPFFCCVKCLSVYPVVGRRVSQSIGAGQPGAFVDVWSTASCVAGGEAWTLYCGDSDGTVSVFQRAPTSVTKRLAVTAKSCDSLIIDQLTDTEVTLRRRWTHLHSLAITGLVLVPEHNFLLSMGNDGKCRILDYLQGKTFMTIESESLFTSVAWDLAHEHLVLGDASGVVQIWNTYTESLLLKEKVATEIVSTGPRQGQSFKALLGFHSSKADGMLYAMSPSRGCFFRWKMVKTDGGALIGHHDDSIIGLGFQEMSAFAGRRNTPAVDSSPGPGVMTTTMERNLGSQKPANGVTKNDGMCVATLISHEKDNAAVLCQKHDQKSAGEQEVGFGLVALSASMDGMIRAWEMLGKSEKYRMKHAAGVEVTSMLVLPSGTVLVTGTDDGNVRFWRLDTGAGESIQAHENTVTALAAYRDGQGSLTLASADFEGVIAIWRASAKDGLKQHTVPVVEFSVPRAHGANDGSDAEILCLAFVAADTPLLASAGNDRAVRCWSLRKHTCILLSVLQGHTDSIEALVSDGLFVLSGSCDGTVRVWNISSLDPEDTGGFEESNRCRKEAEEAKAVAVGVFQAHKNGVADMAVMAVMTDTTSECEESAIWAAGIYGDEMEGMLITCGKTEGVVKIWDYTHVGEDGTCGRLINEVGSHDEALFSCVACTQDAAGKPFLIAGTNKGCIVQLAF